MITVSCSTAMQTIRNSIETTDKGRNEDLATRMTGQGISTGGVDLDCDCYDARFTSEMGHVWTAPH